ncbi:polysaccharide ABC transporter ATP-binding protein [Luteimicrobium subarcticum]|uniref:Lipopolysaccharide transport system ATP-binding protein n=1 Tax=Luteimicrobium subarcticum TaxID=620910 RepID=A0A2M8WT92_9MICO|nr:ABC transporter ATP-binding protein [Luteimicrobium subarcticum]PJI94114.1 lipopolysaccharide transport system ATP-binding protein [Luteimicrobium subarcticum]
MPPNQPAVRAVGLGKTFQIGRTDSRATAVEAALRFVRNPSRRGAASELRVLDDLTFDIEWGSATGIIGRNGAGKSTLLKILTRVSPPTDGRIELAGRVGSLLEVGTGFHPELTGRENIFLNGSLLGMTRKEIRARFDEIVDFSGVEKFLETPVKRYSSGMYVRLAFAVAAHLETEILAIDEVLAVGDADFQAKSLRRMREVAKEGRTVLFVSHQPQTVLSLCTSAMFLDRGQLAYHGDVEGALDLYRRSYEKFAVEQSDPSARPGSGEIRAAEVQVGADQYEPEDEKVVTVHVPPHPAESAPYYVSCHVNDVNGTVLLQCDSRLVGGWYDPTTDNTVELRITSPWLKPGRYTIDVFVCGRVVLDSWEGAAAFEVYPHNPYPEFATDDAFESGLVFPRFQYKVS